MKSLYPLLVALLYTAGLPVAPASAAPDATEAAQPPATVAAPAADPAPPMPDAGEPAPDTAAPQPAPAEPAAPASPGTAAPMPATGVLPESSGKKDVPFQILEADSVEYDDQSSRILAQGNVVTEYKDYRVTADVVAADFEARTATFRGRVLLTTPERTIQGTLLELNLRSRAYAFEGARMLVQPADLQMGAQRPLYATGARIDGMPGQTLVRRGGITSCDLGSPHYLFDAQSMKIIPGKRLTARKVSVYAFGHKLITLPGLTIPLSANNTLQSSRLVPVIGQSIEEGYYLKTAYFYVLGALIGNLRLDLMSKKGVGIGLDQPYDSAHYSGTLHAYQLQNRQDGRRDFNARFDHQHQLGEFGVRMATDYRMNSLPYASASSSSMLTDLGVNYRGTDGSATDLGVNRSENGYGGQSSGSWIARLSHSRSVGAVRANLNFDLNQPFGLTSASSGRLGSRLDLQHTNRLFDAGLQVDRVDTLGGTSNYFVGLQHLPELRIATSTNRLIPSGFFSQAMPVSAELRVGNLREGGYSLGGTSSQPAVKDRIRTYLRLNSAPSLLPRQGMLTFTLPWDFQQSVYRADEAMWAAGISPAVSYRPGASSLLSLNYTLMRRNGYTPFTSDYAGKSHQVTFSGTFGSRINRGYTAYGGGYSAYNTGQTDLGGTAPYGSTQRVGSTTLDRNAAGKVYFTLNSGYDFDVRNASDLVLRTQYQPTGNHLVELETAYDWFGKRNYLNRNRLRDIRARWYVDYDDGLQFGLGALWDTTKNRLGTVRTSLAARISRNWEIQSLWGNVASSYGKSQPYTQVMLTRDLHCWEASAIYTEGTFLGRNERELRFVLSLKAFPTNKQFGVTRSGQQLTTDVGSAY